MMIQDAVIAPKAAYKAILACPACQGTIAMDCEEMRCLDCEEAYQGTASGDQFDLRLKRPKEIKTIYTPVNPDALLTPDIGSPIASSATPACELWESIALADELTYGNRLTRTILSHFPKAEAHDEWMLDLGCGDRRFEAMSRSLTGYNYVGIDFAGKEPDLLADAHALPFKTESFSFILSIAVLEHLAVPAVAMGEVTRVLKPGGTFIGTVAFLEPFHMHSHFHMTHLGLARLLSDAGLELICLEANQDWHGLRAQAEMALFPGLPGALQRAMVALPLRVSAALATAKKAIRGSSATEHVSNVATTGGFRFVARKKAGPTSAFG